MRKIKLQMQITLDGFVGGVNGELDWMIWDWDDILKNYVTDLTNLADTILLGRNFDLYDCDRILRVKGKDFENEKVIMVLNEKGFDCNVLD